ATGRLRRGELARAFRCARSSRDARAQGPGRGHPDLRGAAVGGPCSTPTSARGAGPGMRPTVTLDLVTSARAGSPAVRTRALLRPPTLILAAGLLASFAIAWGHLVPGTCDSSSDTFLFCESNRLRDTVCTCEDR